MRNFADKLIEHIQKKETSLVVGLDPNIKYFPYFLLDANATIEETCLAILRFNKIVIDAVHEHVAAIKPQLAYYEVYGSQGIDVLEKTIEYARSKNLLVIQDAKRGDIGSTSEAYAEAFLGKSKLSGDSVTVNPFLGSDGYMPFIESANEYEKGIFLLIKTSNPSSFEIQDLKLDNGEILYMNLAKEINKLALKTLGENNYSFIGAVVGATYPEEALQIRKLMPHSIFLVPGLGIQGGKAEDMKPYFDERGLGAIISSSRAITYSYYNKNDNNWKSITPDSMFNEILAASINAKKQINEVRFSKTSF